MAKKYEGFGSTAAIGRPNYKISKDERKEYEKNVKQCNKTIEMSIIVFNKISKVSDKDFLEQQY